VNDQKLIKHLQRLKPGEEDVLLIEGEPFYVRRANEDDLESVRESVKGEKPCEK